MPSSTSSVSDLKKDLRDVADSLARREGQRDMLQITLDKTTQDIMTTDSRLDYMKLIEIFLTQFADERQASVYKQIEATVSDGLRTVFGEDIRLSISNKVVGARTETVFTLISETSEGTLETSIMEARGGGVAAIVGFLVQAVLALLTPGMRPILFLDETFRNVSEEYQAPLGEFIEGLCERTGLQVVLVTHQPTIAEYADTHYSFTSKGGKTIIKKET